MSKDTQENPWPGFVDVLSSTLLVFVFLVIVQLLVIAGVSMKVSQTAIEEIKQQLLNKTQTDAEASPQINAEVSPQTNAEANPQTNAETSPQTLVEKDVKSARKTKIEQAVAYDTENPVSLNSAKETLSIDYKGLGTLLEDEDSKQIDQWINDRIKILKNSRIQLNAYLGSPGVPTSTSYYVSYNRMMDLRKRMVALGIPGKNITVRIHNSSEEKHNKVELWILDSTP